MNFDYCCKLYTTEDRISRYAKAGPRMIDGGGVTSTPIVKPTGTPPVVAQQGAAPAAQPSAAAPAAPAAGKPPPAKSSESSPGNVKAAGGKGKTNGGKVPQPSAADKPMKMPVTGPAPDVTADYGPAPNR
jgi:hypothetical protein